MQMNLLNLVSKIFGKELPLPRTSSEIGDYAANFKRAVAFTKSCGFPISQTELQGDDILDKSGDFIEPAMLAAGVKDASKSATQCLKWCHYLSPAFEQQLGRKVWPTIGQIWKKDSFVFNPTWNDLQRWSQSGIQLEDFRPGGGCNFHAWLTVESGEIIEPTFLSSLASLGGGYAKYAGSIVWGRDPNVLQEHRYFPMAVGREFAESISKKSIMPLLASNPDELHQISALLMPISTSQ
jgi:hypothetical protein